MSRDSNSGGLPRAAGWLLVGVGACYSLFALAIAAQTLLAPTGSADGRAAPPLFVAHAVTGSVALLAASVQLGLLTTPPPQRQRRLHRALGRTYVVAAILTSALSVPVVTVFDATPPATAAFLLEAVLWLVSTTLAYSYIRMGQVGRHREWMIRSFAFAAFFVTFSVWDPALAALALPPDTAFAAAVLLGWLVNLIAAEVWIRCTRAIAPSTPQPVLGTEPERSLR